MGDALSAVEGIYFSLQSRLNDMLAACQNDDHRNQIRAKYTTAQQNYWNCINKTFQENDPALQSLESDAKTTCDAIKKIDEQLGDIAAVLRIVSKAVDIGSQIATKVIAL